MSNLSAQEHTKIYCGKDDTLSFEYSNDCGGKTIILKCELAYEVHDDLERKHEWVFSQSALLDLASVLLGKRAVMGSTFMASNAEDVFFTKAMRFKYDKNDGVSLDYCVIPADLESSINQTFINTSLEEGAFPSPGQIRSFNLQGRLGAFNISSSDQSLLAMFVVRRLADSWGLSVLDVLTLLPMSNTKPVII